MNENEIKLTRFLLSDAKFVLSVMREIGTISDSYYEAAMLNCSNYQIYNAITERNPNSIFYVIWKNEEIPIGVVELDMSARHKRAQVIIYITERHRSPSYAVKVWERICNIASTCKMRKLVMEVASWNMPMISGLRKLSDVQEEAILHDHIVRDGEFFDTHVFAKFFETRAVN